MALTLTIGSEPLAICRLPASPPLPSWIGNHGLRSATWTADELSVVCGAAQVPKDVIAEEGWRSLQVEGPLDFSLTGILLAIAAPLAAANISLFALSTFDTDYVLVKEADLNAAVSALKRAGHQIH
ncbi:ACT domain-containing protein [filamentous cyanobacterium CCP5]|nr:ACT domain-containing protein [filamentous cyanobacterium CCP5]